MARRKADDGHDLGGVAGPLFQTPTEGPRDGETFDPAKDTIRLNNQHARVAKLMRDGEWRTLHTISRWTGDPEASVSARLRDFRKERFGSHQIERRRVKTAPGLWEYRLVLNPEVQLLFDESGGDARR
jgi:hypothetical protein